MTNLVPARLFRDDPRLPAVLSLIQNAFAFMDARIEPPSSMHSLKLEDIATQAANGEVWTIGTSPIACVFLKPRGDALYLSKLAVAEPARGQGLAAKLVAVAQSRATQAGLAALELDVRIALTENHAVFKKMGFAVHRDGYHAGFSHPTYFTMRKNIR